MPTEIIQLEDLERNKTVLRVKGELLLADANLLKKIALEMREETGKTMAIDLADLDFMDSESASVIVELENEHSFEIEGLQFFLQKIVEEAENKR